MKTLITALAGGAIILGMYFFSLRGSAVDEYEAVLPRVDDIKETIILQGNVAEEKREKYYSGGAAVITALYVSVGDQVLPGQLLMALEKTETENEMISSDMTRLIEKACEDALSGADPDDISKELTEAFAAASGERVLRTAIYSKGAGTVMALGGGVGDYVSGIIPVAEICDPSGLVISAMASEDDIAGIYEGMECSINISALERHMNGTVRNIMPFAKTTGYLTGSAFVATEVIIDVSDPYKLRPGYTASVTAEHTVSEDALLLPYECIMRDGEEQYVMAENGGIISRITVVTGRELEHEVEIKAGITENTAVLLAPSASLEGLKVRK